MQPFFRGHNAHGFSGVVASIVDLVYCVELLDLEDSTWREACVSITTYVPYRLSQPLDMPEF
jgi:hypothetical protein